MTSKKKHTTWTKKGKRSSQIAKELPRDEKGRFIKGTTLVVDEYGNMGKDSKDPFIIVVTTTRSRSAYGECVPKEYRKNEKGRELKARDASMDAKKTVLANVDRTDAVVDVITAYKPASSNGRELYRRTAKKAIKKALRRLPKNTAVSVVADQHSAYDEDENISDDLRLKDTRVKVAVQRKHDPVLRTHDYVTYAAGMKAEGKDGSLFEIIKGHVKRRKW